ncbi:MAG: Gfo/Idh/MocA family oxidoreductase [Alkalispirochaeta sp.]
MSLRSSDRAVSPADTVKVAFIGLGRICSLLEDDPRREKPATHAGAFAARSDCRILGGFDTDRDRREAFATRWNTRGFDSAPDLLDGESRPHVLVIATHPDSHEHYLQMAVQREIPVVVCEKPLAHTQSAARRMMRLERRGTTRVVVNHERRFSHDYILARRAVENEELGSLVAVRAQLFFGRTARHDRVFLHDGTHLVDVIHFLSGDTLAMGPKFGTYRSNHSSVFLQGRLRRREIPVSIEVGADREYLHFELDLSFSEGRIRVGNGIFEWSRSMESPYYSGYRSIVPLHRYPPEPTGFFSGMAEEVVGLVRDSTRRSRSSAEDGWQAMRVIASVGRRI